jgi:hypothetical protein
MNGWCGAERGVRSRANIVVQYPYARERVRYRDEDGRGQGEVVVVEWFVLRKKEASNLPMHRGSVRGKLIQKGLDVLCHALNLGKSSCSTRRGSYKMRRVAPKWRPT